jgi:hypothetical protein
MGDPSLSWIFGVEKVLFFDVDCSILHCNEGSLYAFTANISR